MRLLDPKARHWTCRVTVDMPLLLSMWIFTYAILTDLIWHHKYRVTLIELKASMRYLHLSESSGEDWYGVLWGRTAAKGWRKNGKTDAEGNYKRPLAVWSPVTVWCQRNPWCLICELNAMGWGWKMNSEDGGRMRDDTIAARTNGSKSV